MHGSVNATTGQGAGTGNGSTNTSTETQSGQTQSGQSQLQAQANSVLNSSTFPYASTFHTMNGLHPYAYHEAAAAAAAACAWATPLGRLDPSSAGAFQGLAASQAFRRSGMFIALFPISLSLPPSLSPSRSLKLAGK